MDLLSRLERWQVLERHAYVSMGAYPMEDHKLMHRLFGLTRLVSFDLDEETVKRQMFNRPLGSCVCLCLSSGDVVRDIEGVLNQASIVDHSGIIVWLDFTAPGRIGEQIREFHDLLDGLAENDIVRVTVNANVSSLGESTVDEDGRRIDAERLRKIRFDCLSERIQEYLPSDSVASTLTNAEYPRILAKSFGVAAAKAFPFTDRRVFEPISIVTYADGQQMLSITGVVLDRNERDRFYDRTDIKSWPFFVSDWKDLHRLVVPDLTYRERLFLEQQMMNPSESSVFDQMGFTLGFDPKKFLQDYRKYYRFYPSLLAAD